MQLTGRDVRHQGAAGEAGAPWRQIAWRATVTLVLVALVKPVTVIVARAAGADLAPQVPLVLTLGISLVWIIVMAATSTPTVMATLVVAGVIQALAGAILMLVAGWVLGGAPTGLLTNLVELAVALGAGVVWGVVCASVAIAVRNAREQASERRGKALSVPK